MSIDDVMSKFESTAAGRPWGRAALWLAFLAPFFYLTYGLSNWLASMRSHVPSIVFSWETSIPFVAWTIIPYWSINAFYGLSLFVCTSRQELDTHGKRLLTAQIIAVICFILLPLRFSFPQPATDGFSGFLFAALASFDQPYNQAPSLHIALLVILWVFYERHVPAWAKWPLHIWFFLVGVSVLTTYQHHVIDIPTGILLGALCLWLWPDRGDAPITAFAMTQDRRRLVLAGRYAAGAVLLAATALWFQEEALVLLWPTVSLTVVAANYAFFGVDGFQKAEDGRMSFAARVLLAPYLMGAWANSRAWTRTDPEPVAVAPGVSLGRIPDRDVAAEFSSIIDLSAELPLNHGEVPWHAFPMLDLVTPNPAMLRAAAAAIERARVDGPVLVCCALGFSRSAAAIATWLALYGHTVSVPAAVEQIRRVRPRIVLGMEAINAIMRAAGPRP